MHATAPPIPSFSDHPNNYRILTFISFAIDFS